jgi:small nuclear ribonucleoprotein (snRNP)-like protein
MGPIIEAKLSAYDSDHNDILSNTSTVEEFMNIVLSNIDNIWQ